MVGKVTGASPGNIEAGSRVGGLVIIELVVGVGVARGAAKVAEEIGRLIVDAVNHWPGGSIVETDGEVGGVAGRSCTVWFVESTKNLGGGCGSDGGRGGGGMTFGSVVTS